MKSIQKSSAQLCIAIISCLPSLACADYKISEHTIVSQSSEPGLKYLLYTPENVESERRYPVLIALYGAGGSLTNYNFADSAFKDLRRELERHKYFVVVPDLGPSHFMNDPAIRNLDCLIEELSNNPQIDIQRVHLLGTSMGGGSALAYAIKRRDRIRSVVSHMGMTDFATWVTENPSYQRAVAAAFGGAVEQVPDAYRSRSAVGNAQLLKRIQVMLIHGSHDQVVLPSHSETLHDAIQKAGGASTLKIVKGGKHEDATIAGLGSDIVKFLETAGTQPPAESPAGTRRETSKLLPKRVPLQLMDLKVGAEP